MTTAELRSIIERVLGGRLAYRQFDDGYTIVSSPIVLPDGYVRVFRETENYGDRWLATDRMYQSMVTAGVLSEDDGTSPNHMEGE